MSDNKEYSNNNYRTITQDANLKKMMTNNEDVDIEETIMNLIMAENVHRIAMSSGARIIQPSLMDFLR